MGDAGVVSGEFTAEAESAIEMMLRKRVENAPTRVRGRVVSGLAWAGVKVAAAVLLMAGVGVGLGMGTILMTWAARSRSGRT